MIRAAMETENGAHVRLSASDGVAAFDEMVAAYRERTGREPTDLDELVRAGLLPSLPRDPFDGKYVWVASAGEAPHSTRPDNRPMMVR